MVGRKRNIEWRYGLNMQMHPLCEVDDRRAERRVGASSKRSRRVVRCQRLGLVLLVVFAVGSTRASSVQAVNTQTLQLDVRPGKLGKERRSSVAVRIGAETSAPDSVNGIPSPTVTASFDFDAAFRFNTRLRRLARCEAWEINGLTTALALQKCPRSKIGEGTATARIPWPSPNPSCGGFLCLEVEAKITAFHSSPEAGTGNPRLLLFVRRDDTYLGTTIIGTLRPSRAGVAFGKRLDVVVPPIAADAALVGLDVTIGGAFRKEYVSARCSNRSKRLAIRGAVHYEDGTSLFPRASSRCFPV